MATMSDKPVDHLSYNQLQQELQCCSEVDALRHDLRRECLRRAERWGMVANCSGLVVLGFVAVLSLVSLLQG